MEFEIRDEKIFQRKVLFSDLYYYMIELFFIQYTFFVILNYHLFLEFSYFIVVVV